MYDISRLWQQSDLKSKLYDVLGKDNANNYQDQTIQEKNSLSVFGILYLSR